MRLNSFLDLARDSVGMPGYVAQQLLNMRLSPQIVWMAALIFSCVNAIVVWGGIALVAPDDILVNMSGPMAMAAANLGVTAVSAVMLTHVGRLFGGVATFEQIFVIETWVLGLRIPVVIAVNLLGFAVPSLASIVGLIAGFLLFWITLNMLATAHGLKSLWHAFGVIVVSAIATAVIAVIVMSVTGINPTEFLLNV